MSEKETITEADVGTLESVVKPNPYAADTNDFWTCCNHIKYDLEFNADSVGPEALIKAANLDAAEKTSLGTTIGKWLAKQS